MYLWYFVTVSCRRWDQFQYLIRRIIVKSRKAAKFVSSILQWLWNVTVSAALLTRRPYNIQISKWCDNSHMIQTTNFMGLLPWNWGLCVHRECRERFHRHRQRKQLVSDRGMHHGTCVTHVPWCMSRSLTRGDGENVPGIPCTTRNLGIW